MLRTNSGALAAVSAARGHMERPDDMEHVFLERIGRGLVVRAEVVIIKHALFAAARGAHVAAGVAADAARQLAAPESETFFRRHGFELCYLVEAVIVGDLFTLFTDQLVEADDLLALAARAMAFLRGRGYVVPDDVRNVAHDVLRHRIGLTYEAEAAEMTADSIISEIMAKVEVP